MNDEARCVNTEAIFVTPATAADVPAIHQLLAEANLEHHDVSPNLRHFLVARFGGNVIGTIGAEVYAPDALLRSLAVAPAYRTRGLGERLVRELVSNSGPWKVERWWLLTTTAQEFFTWLKFNEVSRESAPSTIRRTRQFSGGCLCSAVCFTHARE